jgi:hypothetical protein
MSRLGDLIQEVGSLLSSACANEQVPEAMTITLDATVHFTGGESRELELPPGDYLADASAEGGLHLTSVDGQSDWRIPALPTWHGFRLRSPLALTIPTEKDERHVLVLLPGGAALWSSGSIGTREADSPTTVSTSAIAEHILYKHGSMFGVLPFDRSLLSSSSSKPLWGTIEPGDSPSSFGPGGVPPHWISATVATSYGGPGQPGQPSPTGSPVRRGPFPGYIVSVTPATVNWPLSMTGRVVQLHVTSHIVSVGLPTVLFMTWTDVYQMVPQTFGPVTFPGVIVATGHVPTRPPAPGTSWPAEVAKMFTSSSGQGAPTEFELRVEGVTVATRSCQFQGRFPGTPALSCP